MWYNIYMEYKSNNNVVYSCKYHVVWCPKYRRKVLVGNIAECLKELIAQKAAEINAEVIEMEVMPNHVHLLIEVDPAVRYQPSRKTYQGGFFTRFAV